MGQSPSWTLGDKEVIKTRDQRSETDFILGQLLILGAHVLWQIYLHSTHLTSYLSAETGK